MKKIYPKEWLELHPYKRTDSVDQYYVDIANEIYDVLDFSAVTDGLGSDESIRYTSLCLAAWFEDIISQTGIWQTFTSECKKRYGAYLPFYTLNEDYFPDEVNVEDVRFLLWHHMQYVRQGEKRIINPENPGIEEVAREVYEILFDEYEDAPENEKMQNFLCHSTEGKNDFYAYREVLEWFHYRCYINIANFEQYMESAERLLKNEDIEPKKVNVMLYATRVSLIIRGRKNLLSLTSVEWLALLGKTYAKNELWANAKVKRDGCFLLVKEDEDFLYFKDLTSEQEEEYKVTKESVQLSDLKNRKIGESTFICEMIYYGNVWWQYGMMVERKLNEKAQEYIDDLKEAHTRVNEKAVFRDFMRASGGKFFVFCKSREEVEDFLFNKMEYNKASEVEMPQIDATEGVVIMASPYSGLHIQFRLCECIKSPGNPFYNREKAEENALALIANPDVIPYALSCVLQDKGMLPDACLNSLKGREYGKEFLHKHAGFITDYYHCQCRDKDFCDEELLKWM